MKAFQIVTIEREYASGGTQVGRLLGKALGVPVYGREILEIAAKESGTTPEYIEQLEETDTNSLLYSLVAMAKTTQGQLPQISQTDQLNLLESQIIQRLAQEGPCVIVGRCANFILKGRPNLFSVFLHADRATRMQRVTENYGVKPGGAAKAMDLMDSRRRTHCLHYTGQELGNARLYDLCVNTSDYGLERTVELILEAINTRTEQSPASETAPVREPALPEPEAEDIQGEISLA